MMKPRIVIIGAGGHGKVVCDTILAEDKYEIIGFMDSTLPLGTEVINNYKVIASQNDEMNSLKKLADYFIIAIGNNMVRKKLYNELKQILKPATIIHPSAVVTGNVLMQEGSICLANSVVSVNCRIGENVIINAGVIVDHECVIGNHVHLSIGTMVGSNTMIADEVKTRIGESIQPFSKINTG